MEEQVDVPCKGGEPQSGGSSEHQDACEAAHPTKEHIKERPRHRDPYDISPRRRRHRSRSHDEDEYGYHRRGGRSSSHRNDRDRYSRSRHYREDSSRYRRRRSRSRERRKTVKEISGDDELAQLDRTMRTVQVFNLNLKADERDLFQFFSQAGPLADIKIIKDRQSGRSKGFAYVEFEKKEGVPGAMALSGQELMGQAVMVKPSEAEKNVAWHAAQAAKKAKQEGGHLQDAEGKVKLLNIHPSLTEEFLKPIFEPFGPVFSVNLDRDSNSGASKGTATVQFVNARDAAQAVTELKDKIDIQGMVMTLELVQNTGLTNGDGKSSHFVEERIDVDADDGGGMRLSAQSRVELMNKLAANAGIEVPKMDQTWFMPQTNDASKDDDIALTQGVLGPASPIPTSCVLLKNAFDPSQEMEPSWDEEIRGDIREECSKFGQVLFVHVDTNSPGFVYLKFDDMQAAVAAQKALHRRWYNQRQLHVEFQFVPLFDKHFGL